MKKEEMSTFIENLSNKLGENSVGLIQDDLATLINDNNLVNTTLENKDKEIVDLTKERDNLLQVNANLFKQVGIGEEKPIEEKNEEFSFSSIFDEKGNFIK